MWNNTDARVNRNQEKPFLICLHSLLIPPMFGVYGSRPGLWVVVGQEVKHKLAKEAQA
jgi:hypothetical protein